jgi:hypothetical protein
MHISYLGCYEFHNSRLWINGHDIHFDLMQSMKFSRGWISFMIGQNGVANKQTSILFRMKVDALVS